MVTEFPNPNSSENLSEQDAKNICSATNSFCGIAEHPDLVELTPTVLQEIKKLDPDLIAVKKEEGKVIAWSIGLPVNIETADKFLERGITEKEMYALSLEHPNFQAIYFLFAYVVEANRGSGIGIRMIADQIAKLKSKHPDLSKLLAAVTNDDAKRAIEGLRKTRGLVVDFIEYEK